MRGGHKGPKERRRRGRAQRVKKRQIEQIRVSIEMQRKKESRNERKRKQAESSRAWDGHDEREGEETRVRGGVGRGALESVRGEGEEKKQDAMKKRK